MKTIKILVIVILTLVTNTLINANDKIVLKNGDVVVGEIIDYNEGVNYKILTDKGTTITYPIQMIESIEYKVLSRSNSSFLSETTSGEIGFVFSNPAGLNLVLSKHTENFLFRISGMYWGDNARGIELNLGYKIFENEMLYHAINIIAGTSYYNNDYDGLKLVSNYPDEWEYLGIGYNINLFNFYLQSAMVLGNETHINPYLTIQLGYVYKFNK